MTPTLSIRGLRCAAVLVGALATAGCAQKFAQIGQAPSMSPMGRPSAPIDPNVISPRSPITSELDAHSQMRRVALAQADAARAQRAMLTARQSSAASLWSAGPKSLFDDRRARRIGDIVTVMIEIDDEATINNSTTRSRERL